MPTHYIGNKDFPFVFLLFSFENENWLMYNLPLACKINHNKTQINRILNHNKYKPQKS